MKIWYHGWRKRTGMAGLDPTVHETIKNYHGTADPLGSYGGMTEKGHAPVQDADDL